MIRLVPMSMPLTLTLTAALLLGMTAALAAPPAPGAAAVTPQPRGLSDVRESEQSYGLSLRPPLGTRMVRQTADDYAMRIADEGGQFTMALLFKETAKDISLQEVAEGVARQAIGAQSGNVLVSAEPRRIAGRPATVMFYKVRELIRGKKIGELLRDERVEPTWMLAQAIIQIDARTFATLETRCPLTEAAVVQPTFEQVIASIEITDPRELLARRKEQIARGSAWRTATPAKALHDAMVAEQWFRLVENTADGRAQDYGWMRVRQTPGRNGDSAGIRIEMIAHAEAGQSSYDTQADYFLADDDSTELWSIRTTERPVGKADPKKKYPTYVQTGVRASGQLTVNTADPINGARTQNFAVPPEGYLSQVEALMLPQTLPAGERQSFGFYVYNPNTASVTFRTEEVVPVLGKLTIVTRLSPNDPELKATYSAQRRLEQKQLDSKGNRMIPGSAALIKQLWANR